MLLTRKSVELLAPAGSWEVLEAAVRAGADAVYLGGKRFNMRMHRADTNFDDASLKAAVDYAHAHGVRLYVTVNNLLSDREIDPMRDYLKLLESIQPDALLVQDLAMLELARSLDITIPLHASVMMNTHNAPAIEELKAYGITRVVVGRETTLSQLSLLKERTGIEIEYFMHGDMCIAQSGQCYHSGVLFGQSSNRGRCLKPCRWPYRLIDEKTGEILDSSAPGSYKLALKDMCMYRNLPELIQAGVHSFKIEGRMRTAAYVERIVRTYRAAIDRYIADPAGYQVDEAAWNILYESRSRDFSTCFALGKPDASAIGFTGEREPRFFSQAVKETGLNAPLLAKETQPSPLSAQYVPKLFVRAGDPESAEEALANGADAVIVGGEAFLPQRPWTLSMMQSIMKTAQKWQAKVVISTPRATTERECGELFQLFCALEELRPAGLMVSNLGVLRMANQQTSLPIYTDFSFNTFNSLSAKFLRDHRAVMGTVSLEAAYPEAKGLLECSPLPLALIVHGPLEAMVADHDIPSMSLDFDPWKSAIFHDRHYALLDSAQEAHPIRIDQYGRSHILFAKDLCLFPHLANFTRAAAFRIEAQHYTAAFAGRVTRIYRDALNRLATNPADYRPDDSALLEIEKLSPRALSVGALRYRVSR